MDTVRLTVATLAEAAAHLGVSLSTLKRQRAAGLLGDACAPRGRDGVDLERLRHTVARALGRRDDSAPEVLDPERERARKDAAMADKLELEVAARRGELVPAAEAESEVAAVFADAGDRLDEIGPRLLARHPEARALVEEVEAEIHAVRGRIADGAGRG